MDPITQQTVLAAAGAAGGDPVYVDDVFSTFLYDGDGSNPRNINNGIDLAGEGGLVWVKSRNLSEDHIWVDTERGATNRLWSNSSNAQVTNGGTVKGFNNNGFQIDSNGYVNGSTGTYASWTFRKAPGFFDVVTYTGNGTAGRTIAHNLGSVPGMIIVKGTNVAEPWAVYHRSLGNTKYLSLSETSGEQTSTLRWNDTTPTSSVFTVGSDPNVNQNTKTYVAYIFAHDDAQYGTDSDESIIKCGSYTSNGSEQEINLGFEPQFVLIKSSSASGGWYLFDSMRGINTGSAEPTLQTQETNAEAADNNGNIALTATGFRTDYNGGGLNESPKTYIYMAIRRPNKPPEVGTEVFQSLTYSGSGGDITRSTNILVDFVIAQRTAGGDPYISDRLRGPKQGLIPSATSGENPLSNFFSEFGNNYIKMGNSAAVNDGGTPYLLSMFKRAPGFMDVVAYSGDASSQNVSHNLSVIPELIIVKRRNLTEDWAVYHSDLGANKYLKLNQTGSSITSNNIWSNTSPTSSVFTVGTDGSVNLSGNTFIAYLFATLPGISKVGSYSGTGNDINVDCGFTNGARFVLIKRTDATGGWWLFDSTRGIVSGNDPGLELNTSNAQNTTIDCIDPLSSGFTVASTALTEINTSGGNYLFLAIA